MDLFIVKFFIRDAAQIDVSCHFNILKTQFFLI